MSQVIKLDDYRPCPTLIIDTEDGHIHVLPVSYIIAYLNGESVIPLDESIVRKIIKEWLEIVTE